VLFVFALSWEYYGSYEVHLLQERLKPEHFRRRGRLTIESTLGHGAAFTVRLPLSPAPARVETAAD
jgi:hypothetical protein